MNAAAILEEVSFNGLNVSGLSRNWQAGYQGEFHYHDCGQLIYISSGILILDNGECAEVISPRLVAWIPPRYPHAVYADSNVSVKSVYFNSSEAEQMSTMKHSLTVKPIVRELILELFNVGFDVKTNEIQDAISKCLKLEVIRTKKESVSRGIPTPCDSRIKPIVEDVLRDPKIYLNRNSWSETIGLSGRTVDRIFKSEIGMSFGAWKMEFMYSEMMRRVSEGDSPSVVAIELGYSELSSFTKSFKRKFGRPPADYCGHRR